MLLNREIRGKYIWGRFIRYGWWKEALLIDWPPSYMWWYIKHGDQEYEDRQDLLGCYCMGGEL